MFFFWIRNQLLIECFAASSFLSWFRRTDFAWAHIWCVWRISGWAATTILLWEMTKRFDFDWQIPVPEPLLAGAVFDRWTEEKDNTDLELACTFKVDEYGFFIYWKSDARVSKTKFLLCFTVRLFNSVDSIVSVSKQFLGSIKNSKFKCLLYCCAFIMRNRIPRCLFFFCSAQIHFSGGRHKIFQWYFCELRMKHSNETRYRIEIKQIPNKQISAIFFFFLLRVYSSIRLWANTYNCEAICYK